MRWHKTPKPLPGTGRVILQFLWFPKTLKNETRWLEKAPVLQIYDCEKWNDFRFIPDEVKYEENAFF